MGRIEPSRGLQPPTQRKDARSKHARTTLHKTVPAFLSSTPRARKGVDAAELITNPPSPPSPAKSTPQPPAPPPTLGLVVADTLAAAAQLHRDSSNGRGGSRKNVAVLNMASPLRPGGGVLNGATSQEEMLCVRTTLHASLREEWYRLPEVGAIWSPDVLVFCDGEGVELRKGERWFVDVVSAGMLRFPDVEGGKGDDVGGVYAGEGEREVVEKKMRAVLRVLVGKGVERVVLGAWGCGAYGNPVGEVARAWRKVLLGEGKLQGRRKGSETSGGAGVETWAGLKEVVFAIKDTKMAAQFAKCFGNGLDVEKLTRGADDSETESNDDRQDREEDDLEAKVAELNEQLQRVLNPDLKARLQSVLQGLEMKLKDRVPTNEPGSKSMGAGDSQEDGDKRRENTDNLMEDDDFFANNFFDNNSLKPGMQQRQQSLDR